MFNITYLLPYIRFYYIFFYNTQFNFDKINLNHIEEIKQVLLNFEPKL